MTFKSFRRLIGNSFINGMLVASIGFSSSFALAADKVKITFWENDSADVIGEMDKWIKVFQKRNPNIKVVRQHYETEELRTKFLRSSITGDGADLVYGPNDMAGVFKTAGVIQPLDSWVKPGLFKPATLNITKLDGKVWGIPVSEGNHLMLLYNKKLVKEAPKTTDELIAIAKKHTNPAAKKHGLAMYQAEPFWFVTMLHGFGGKSLVKGKDGVKVTIDTPEMKKALQFLVDLKDKHKILPKECNYDCAKSMFMGENAPFYIIGDWEVNNMRKRFGKDLGVAPLPVISESGKPMSPMLSGRFLFVSKRVKGEKAKAVKKFVNFMVSKKIQVRLGKKISRIPASLEAKNSPKIKSIPELAQLIDATKNATPMPCEVEMRAAWDGMRIMVQRALTGTETIDKALKTGQKAANEALQSISKKK